MLSNEQDLKYLTQEDVQRFLAAIPKDRLRDRLLFGMIYRYGLRTQEACDLPATAVDLSGTDCPSARSKERCFFLPRKYGTPAWACPTA